jgi:hypothetical protein
MASSVLSRAAMEITLAAAVRGDDAAQRLPHGQILDINEDSPPRFLYIPDFLDTAFACELRNFCDSLEFHKYPYRGRQLKRSPKVEYRKDDTVGPYRWGQERRAADLVNTGFPDILRRLVDAVSPEINHVIIIKYTDGKEHHMCVRRVMTRCD